MREIKELFSKPINTLFLGFAIFLTIFSLDTVAQIIGSNYERQTLNNKFYENHISLKFNTNDFNKFISLDSSTDYVYTHIDESVSFGNAIRKLDIFGMNNYSSIEKFFETQHSKYFSLNDYISGNKVAIVGELVKDFTYTKNNIEYISIDNVEYKVIDYLKNTKNSHWRNAILVPSKSLKSTFYTANIINIPKNENYKTTLTQIKNTFTNIEIFEHTFNKKDSLLNAITFDSSILKDLLLLTIFGILNIVIATLFWIKSMYSDIFIKISIGANIICLLKEFLYKTTLINIVALFSSTLISINFIPIIGKTYSIPINYNIYTTYLVFLISLLIVLIISLSCIFIIYIRIVKTGAIYHEK